MKGYSDNCYRAKIDNNGFTIDNNGFTLVELLVTTVIVGIIAAVIAPNLIGMIRNQQVSGSMLSITGAIREAQKQAIRQGRQCTVIINDTTKTVLGSPPACILKTRAIDSNVYIRASSILGNPPDITFSSKGNTTNAGTIVVSSEASELQKCFVISYGLGISRTGDYTGSKTGAVYGGYCES